MVYFYNILVFWHNILFSFRLCHLLCIRFCSICKFTFPMQVFDCLYSGVLGAEIASRCLSRDVSIYVGLHANRSKKPTFYMHVSEVPSQLAVSGCAVRFGTVTLHVPIKMGPTGGGGPIPTQYVISGRLGPSTSRATLSRRE